MSGGALWRADLSASSVRVRRRLFAGSWVTRPQQVSVANFDVHPDGNLFAFVAYSGAVPEESVPLLELEVVVNWFDELRQRVGGGG